MHWRNSNFQIANFLAGKCHTADEAYRLLCELREDRDLAIRASAAARLRSEAKIIRANAVLASAKDEADKLEARADIEEVAAYANQSQSVYDQSVRERSYIDQLIEKIKPLRKYKDLPDEEAHQATQREEWKLKLIHRAKTFLLTSGTIPQDQFDIMMAHPDFHSEIVPAIEAVNESMKLGPISLGSLPRSAEFIPRLLGGPDAL